MRWQIINRDNVVAFEDRHHELFDIGPKSLSVHRAIDQQRGHHPIMPQRRDKGEGLAITKRHMIDEPHPARPVPIEPHHLGVHACFVDEYQPSRIKHALLAYPFAAGPHHILALPFAGAKTLLLEGDVVTAEKPPQRTSAGADSPHLQDDQQFHKRHIRLCPHHLQDYHRMHFQRRDTAAAWFCIGAATLLPPLQPLDRGVVGGEKHLCRLAPRSASPHHLDHPYPQIPRIGLRHRRPPANESMPQSLTPPDGTRPDSNQPATAVSSPSFVST